MSQEDIAGNGPSTFQTSASDEAIQAPPDSAETPSDETGAEEPATNPNEADTPPAQADTATAKKRFKSHEEAEESYKKLQADYTRKAQRLAELEKREAEIRDQVERQRGFEDRVAKLKAFRVERHQALLEDLARLDPDDPEYRKKSAETWADYDADIERERFRLDQRGPERRATDQGQEDVAEARRAVTEAMKASGIAMDDPVFHGFATQIDGQFGHLPIAERARMAIEKTTEYKNRIAAEARAKAGQPLTRGGAGRPAAPDEPARDRSLAEIISDRRRKR